MKIFLILVGFLTFGAANAQSPTLPAKPTSSSVYDPTGLLKKEEIKYFDSVSKALLSSKKCGSYVVIIDSLEGYSTLKSYGYALFDHWKLNKDTSLNYFIVYVKKLNGVSIIASSQLLKTVNTDYMKMVTEKSMRPLFMQKKKFEALKKGNQMMVLKIESN